MKKALSLVLIIAMVFGLAACSRTANIINTDTNNVVPTDPNSIAGTYRILVWCPDEACVIFTKQIADFNASNGHGIIIDAVVSGMPVDSAEGSFPTDLSEGPDLFIFSQEQLDTLIKRGIIDELGDEAAKFIIDSNDATAVSAASIGEKLYAYPLTSDLGYVMYYNKSIIPESDIDSLEKILADCKTAGRELSMMADTGRGLVSFFFATGCVSEWETDEEMVCTEVNDSFDSPAGLTAAKALYMLEKSGCYRYSDNPTSFSSGSAVVIAGLDAYREAREILGEDLGVADLPSFSVGGEAYHMSSFSGCKLLGIKHQDDEKAVNVLNQLAQFLADYDRQMERVSTLGWGPSDLKAQGTDTVKSNAAFAALMEQNSYAKVEGHIHITWWTIAKSLAARIAESDGSDAQLQEALDKYEAAVEELINED